MAEARQAVVASSATLAPHRLVRRASIDPVRQEFIDLTQEMIRGSIFETRDRNVVSVTIRGLYHSIRIRFDRLKTTVANALFPATAGSWMASLLAVVAGRWLLPELAASLERWIPGLHHVASGTPRDVVSTCLAATACWVGGSVLARFSLKLLLSYKGFLYEEPRRTRFSTRLWVLAVKVLEGFGTPRTYSYQPVLPTLPVPSLQDTCDRYLDSMRPLLDDAEYERMNRLAGDFAAGEGRTLQLILILKSLWSTNYVTDWWERFVYLRGRDSIMINSNFYISDSYVWVPTTNREARAAMFIYNAIDFKQLLEREQLEPLMLKGAIPLCMAQYLRTFGTTRIPGIEKDELQHVKHSNHVAVLCNGHFYIFKFRDINGHRLSRRDIEEQLNWIVQDAAEAPESPVEAQLPAMTAASRTEWASFRNEYLSRGINRASLEAVERAAFLVVLDDAEPEHPGNHGLDEEDELCKLLIHGSGVNRWFDKSFSCIAFKNGRLGGNVEHSWADAPVAAHLWEFVMANEFKIGYDDITKRNKAFPALVRTKFKPPLRLKWDFCDEALEVIEDCVTDVKAHIADLDLHVIAHDWYSKGFMKKCQMSPDAYIQMALQLAYYRDAGHFAQTYEASMTRLFREGRTETVRPVTDCSTAFVLAMEDETCPPKERARLLRLATSRHVELYRNAMAGKGVDRHLFALYVASVWKGVKSEFLQEVLSVPWSLSTSQTPTQQTMLFDVKNNSMRCTGGGGFGPVAEDGYGVSYIISTDEHLFFHVTSHKSSTVTDTKRFSHHIVRALADMKQLMESENAKP
eukprot:m.12581 g.12581  ORF g.12581 m.12581 type:complete len:802 (+) comp4301_c0_seq1:209-2614(+)